VSKPKLLLADDSITIQKVVNLTFADQGMDVVAFSDGDAAIENFDTVKPDIVLADVHMPGINGYQLCELLRSDAANSKIPVVLLVGSFEPFDRDEAERVGASGYLTKPFSSIAELVSTVENLLTEPTPAEAVAAEVEPETGAARIRRPDTSDIDSLYEQSFVETVEIPKEESEELEFDEIALDDEMIQTSYGEPDPTHDLEETYYSEDLGGSEEETNIAQVNETEELIAQSIPDEPVQFEGYAEDGGSPDLESEVSAEAVQDAPESETRTLPGPFDTVAADLPPIEGSAAVFAAQEDPDEFDVLELPGTPRPRTFGGVPPSAETSSAIQVSSLSPELIDLIVEKVVARLEEKQASSAGE
jgi:CheY-like chemotaxis protein